MLIQTTGRVVRTTPWDDQAQELQISIGGETEGFARALNYPALTGDAAPGDVVLLNITAIYLHLGTGGYGYVIANLTQAKGGQKMLNRGPGHIIKGRYLPCQHTVFTLEEQEQYADFWENRLDGFPVLVGQLHSQIAPAAAALHLSGRAKIAYVMTDQAALPMAFSKLVRELQAAGLLTATLTCGQAFGGDYETVTLHSALLAAKHILNCNAAVVCQGPGNAGTGTKYGFSGIEQAQNLDIVSALGGTAIAIVRVSSADKRERHQGISHHTRTTLELAHSRCLVPLPAGTEATGLPDKHDVRFVDGAQAALDLLAERNIRVTTMGRTPAEDPAFFLAAAAAGMV